ncbi:3735_t:CDS:1, partial [Gigaspora rosea]
ISRNEHDRSGDINIGNSEIRVLVDQPVKTLHHEINKCATYNRCKTST